MQEIKITGATTFVNPFKDEEAAEAKAEEEERIKVLVVHIRALHYRWFAYLGTASVR